MACWLFGSAGSPQIAYLMVTSGRCSHRPVTARARRCRRGLAGRRRRRRGRAGSPAAGGGEEADRGQRGERPPPVRSLAYACHPPPAQPSSPGPIAAQPAGQPLRLGRDQLVGHPPGLVERESAAWTMRVGEDGVVDEVAVLVERRADGQLLAVDRRPGVGGALRRQRARGVGMDAERRRPGRGTSTQASAARLGIQPSPPSFMTLATMRAGSPRRHRLDDHRRVLAAALDLERLARVEPSLRLGVLVEVVGDPARGTRRSGRGRTPPGPWG